MDTKKKDINYVDVDVNVFLNYKAQLKAYSKKYFDPFCRRNRINYKQSLSTTIGQLNFFKWAIENHIISYIQDNIEDIEKDLISKDVKAEKMISGPIRQDGPIDHIIKKSGTPTMGGVIIIVGMLTSTLLWADLNNIYIWTLVFVSLSLGLLGFLDDLLKIKYKNFCNG